MDWSKCPDVERLPDRMSGAWVVRGTRVPADAVIENSAEGYTAEQISEELFPTVSVAAVRRVLEFAKTRADADHPAG